MRDAIVRPIEDQIAGAPDSQAIESAIQPGQATIVARFALNSDSNSDLVQVQGRVQNAQRQLPSDLQTPQITIYDPSQAVVVSLTAKSASLHAGDLSALVTNKIVPAIEQVPGISFVEVNGDVTPSIQVEVRPNALSASGFHHHRHRERDLAQQRARSGRHRVRARTAKRRSTSAATCRRPRRSRICCSVGPSAGSEVDSAFGARRAACFGSATWRSVIDGYEPQRVYGYDHGMPAISLDVQKAGNTSEVRLRKPCWAQSRARAPVSRGELQRAQRAGDVHAGAVPALSRRLSRR